jgi:hypothetical protein
MIPIVTTGLASRGSNQPPLTQGAQLFERPHPTRKKMPNIGSIFLRQHDGHDALGEGWIGRIKGMHRQCGIVIIDLEKDRVAVDLERAKVMSFVGVVGVAKVVIDFDGLEDARDCFGTERRYLSS